MSKKTLNQTNLEELGAERLAALLMEVSAGSADIKRRLRLELSHNLGTSALAHEVRKRLASLRKARSFVSWRKRKALVKDLATQVEMITGKIAPEDPATAFDLLWQFIEVAPNTYERVDDSRGEVGDVFRAALAHFDNIAPRAMLDPVALADRTWTVIEDNGYGEWDGIITYLASSLGATGLDRLKTNIAQFSDAPDDTDTSEHEAFQFLRELRGRTDYVATRKVRYVKSWLQEIAAATDDTASYIAQYSPQDLLRKDVSAEVAMLHLGDGNADTALSILLEAEQDGSSFGQDAWDDAYIAVLDALHRADEAQVHRWACFTDRLNAKHLRAYLKVLPDFEDVDAEDRAKAQVLAFPNFSEALAFCVHWPDLLTAAQLVTTRPSEIDGNHYGLLTPAAEALRERHPMAAVLLWRAMINFALYEGRSSRYRHAADHLSDCAALDTEIADYGDFMSHDQYLQRLRTQHERKSSFWAAVG